MSSTDGSNAGRLDCLSLDFEYIFLRVANLFSRWHPIDRRAD